MSDMHPKIQENYWISNLKAQRQTCTIIYILQVWCNKKYIDDFKSFKFKKMVTLIQIEMICFFT